MRGVSHAVTGIGAWTAIAAPTTAYIEVSHTSVPLSLGVVHLPIAIFLGGYIPVAGASMVPDSDHPKGTIAHSVPGVSKPMCQFVNQVSGGHRHGTHSWVGIGIATFLAWLSTFLIVPIKGHHVPIGAMIIFAMLSAFAIKALKLLNHNHGWFLPWVISIVASLVIGFGSPSTAKWLPLIMFVGCLIHCIGDSLTTGGCPWFWPWIPRPPKNSPISKRIWQENGWMGFPILGNTDTGKEKGMTREKALTGVTMLYALVTLGAVAYHMI